MYLKGLEIDGFKSFADKVRLDFNKGITSIVGPNGSGKSNILDSILWVLGEQSYKNIRAKESSDVIFSGGKNKKPRSSAEVTLIIDNSDKTLNFEEDEVRISRKIKKTGENEYYINSSRSRLKDISELFLDTGVGKSAYSVIGQGRVERIISSSNLELRSIIEEAAGIKKVKLRKAESEKKLENVKIEMEKIDIILGELVENRSRVEKQAIKTRRYKELDKEVKKTKKTILSLELSKKDLELSELKSDLEKQTEGLKKLESDFSKQETDLENVNSQRENLNSQIEELSKKNFQLKDYIDRLMNDKVKYTERLNNFSREREERTGQLGRLKEKIEEKGLLIKELKSGTQSLGKELENEKVENEKFNQDLVKLENEKSALEASLNLKKDKLMDFEVDRVKLINNIEATTRKIKSSKNRSESLNFEMEEYLKKSGDLKKDFEKLSEQKSQLESKLEKLEVEIEETELEINKLSLELNSYLQQKKEHEYNFNRFSAKLDSLEKLEENYEGFFKGVKEVLNAKISGVHGAFISLVNIPEELVTAVDSAAGGSLQDIVVESSGTAKKCIQYLKESKGGRASFLALDTIKSGKPGLKPDIPGVLGIASKLVKFDSKYQKAVDFVLGNLLVVEDVDTGLDILKRNIHRGNIVSLSGELISSRGRMTGGSNLKSTSAAILERKKEIRILSQTISDVKGKLDLADKGYSENLKKIEKIEESLESKDEKREEFFQKIKNISREVDDKKDQLNKIDKNIKLLEVEINEENTYNHEYLNDIENAKSKKDSVDDFITKLKENYEKEKEKLQKISSRMDSLNKESSDKKIKYLNKKERIRQLEGNIHKEEIELQEINFEKNSAIKKLDELNKDIENLNLRLDGLDEEYMDKNSEYKKEFSKVNEKRVENDKLEKEEKKLILDVKNLENQIVLENDKIKRKIEKLEALKGSIESLKDDIEALDSLEMIETESSVEKLKKDLLSLETELNNLGVVNFLAIEEFEEVDEKYKFILGQKEDLVKSEKLLKELIKDIENIVKLKFKDAYENISENFSQMCKEVLNNSIGKLKLTNEEDLLESGIELMVKFKNKKTQSISLLSGGEKSMVAVAFIMAIFMYKPSPFTFFDEIEAALDETNTKRLIRKLKEFTDKSQFILITHNKETMKESDTLYGITMNKELGESKLISVRM